MRVYYVVAGQKSHSCSTHKCGPFTDRREAERMAVELAKRPDCVPPIHVDAADEDD